MGFLNHPIVLLVLKEVLGFVPNKLEVFEHISPILTDVTAWYHTSGMPVRVAQILVIFPYQSLSPILKRWKYEKDELAKDFILNAFETGLKDLPEFSNECAIIPIPLGIDRFLERRYNQSSLLGHVVQKSLGIRYFPWCFRFWSGIHQSTLSKEARQLRKLSFWIPPGIPIPQHVILIDDVISTGSTIQACAQYLIQKGCQRITVIALARSS